MLDDNMGLQYLAPIALPYGVGGWGGDGVSYKLEFTKGKIQRKKYLTPT